MYRLFRNLRVVIIGAGLLCLMSPLGASSVHLVYIGTTPKDPLDEGQGIYRVWLDGDTGKLTEPVLVAQAKTRPAFLAMSPNGKNLYATVVLDKPVKGMKAGVSAYAIDAETGGLDLLNTQSTAGNVGAHLVVDNTGSSLFYANYASASVVCFPLGDDGSIGKLKSFVSLPGGTGVNPQRQKTSCPHSVMLSSDNRFLFVPSLGLDATVRVRFDDSASTIELDDLAAHRSAPGAGPRHAKFSNDGRIFYVLNELNNTVDVLAYESSDGSLSPLQTISTLPDGFVGSSTSAEIRVHPNGKFVYTSNRGHDSIAVFSRNSDSGRLSLVEIVASGGQRPRNFALSADGAWLLCANQDSNNLIVFAVDQETGRLEQSSDEVNLNSPLCVLFAH